MKEIWTKEELKKIRETVKELELKLTQNTHSISAIIKHGKKGQIISEEFDHLLDIENKDEILKILQLTTAIRKKMAINNPNYSNNELIQVLSNVNPDDPTEIFIIFKAIVDQYENIKNNVKKELYNSNQDYQQITTRIKQLIHNDPQSEEAKLIKNRFNEILNTINQITKQSEFKEELFKNPIFKSLLDKCNELNSTTKFNVAWNKNELARITKVITKPSFGFKITENLEIILAPNSTRKPAYSLNFFQQEFEYLFYAPREKVDAILDKAEKVTANIDNPYHRGLIATIAEIKPKENEPKMYEHLFRIILAIINQYYYTIKEFVNYYYKIGNIECLNEIKSTADNIANIIEFIKNEIKTKIFIYANGITDMPPFEQLIEKLDNMIKEILIREINGKITDVKKTETRNAQDPYYYYCAELSKDYRRGKLNERARGIRYRNKNK